MSSLPYCVVLPVSDKTENDRVGLIITDIRCIKADRTDPNKSVVFMHDKSVFHFIAMTVEEVQDEINRVCDGDLE